MSSVAALWDELAGEEDLFGEPLSASFGASPSGGKPFLTGVLDSAYLMVEAAFGADLTANPDMWNWYDITTDVRQADGNKVAITPMGRADEASQSQPAGCGFQLDNTTGAYTANHPGSPWFPYVRRNTPIRVRLYVNGAWSTRFQGYANGWVPSWDTSCNLAVVTLSASGILRRLNQGKTPLRSSLYRAITRTSPVAYWPLEDGKSATEASSAVTGVNPLALIAGVEPSFGSVTQVGSADIADFAPGGNLYAVLPQVTASASWRIEWVGRYQSGGAATSPAFAEPLYWRTNGTATGNEWYVIAKADGTIRVSYTNVGVGTGDTSLIVPGLNVYDGVDRHYRVEVTQVGGTQSVKFYVNGVLQVTDTAATGTIGMIISVTTVPVGVQDDHSTPSMGHIAVWADYASSVDTAAAATGYAGETATDRLIRLCSEQSVPLTIAGTSDTTMGAQTVDTFTNLIRECETTDDGLLYDGLGAGLGYIPRSVRYNAAASLSPDMSADPPQVAIPFVPADDDQRNRNLVKVDRKNGSAATYQDTTGTLGTNAIGTYDSTVTVNTKDDTGLLFRAGHEVKKGTVAGFRYPKLYLDLAAAPTLAPAWLATPLAGRVDTLNVSSKATQHPPGTVSQLIEGYGELLGPFDWTVDLNCSPFDPWRVAVIEGTGDTTWRVEAGASTLQSDAAVGATSLTVVTSDGYPWSTTAGDYPRDIDVGGVQVTVTAVSGSSSPQTFTVSPLAYALHGGWQVTVWHNPKIAL